MSEHIISTTRFPDAPALVREALRRFARGVTHLNIEGLDEDLYHEVAYPLLQAGFRCTGEMSSHRFERLGRDKQHIVVAATCDNYHFLEPVMRLMREEGHLVTPISVNDLTRATLAGVLRQCDVAWFEWGDGPMVIASKLPKYCRIVCRIHGYELFQPHFRQANWKNIDEVVLISDAMKARFIELMGSQLPPGLAITVLGNLTDHQPLTEMTVARDPFHLACVARFIPLKNLLLLLPLMQMLITRDPRYRVSIAGRIEDERMYYSFCQLVTEWGLQAHITVCGALPASEMAAWYQDKSCLISVSYQESQGMGIFEAMLAGLKPVVMEAAGGLSEYLPSCYRFKTLDDAVERIMAPALPGEHYAQEAQTLLRQEELRLRYSALWQRPESKPLFSILIPSYNRERYLLAAVCSALSQRDEHFDVIVVDDGSTDDSLLQLEAINDPRLRIVRKAHTNAPDTRNRAIAQAKGEYLVWLDSDDLLHATALAQYRARVARWPEADVFSCALETHGAEKRFYSQLNHPPARWLHQIIHGNFISNPGVCVRHSLYQRVGGYHPEFVRAHDYEFWSRAIGEAQVMFIPNCNISYRLHDGNLTGIGRAVDMTWEYRIFSALLERYTPEQLLPGHSPQERTRVIAARRQTLRQQCGVDNLLIVLDAIAKTPQQLAPQIAFLARQKDKCFRLLIVSDTPLPYLSQPVVVAQAITPELVSHHLDDAGCAGYWRSYLLESGKPGQTDAICQLKHAIYGEAELPGAFRILAG